MVKAKAVVVKREGGFYHKASGKFIPLPHPKGARVVEGDFEGGVFALCDCYLPIGTEVTVQFVPEDQFAEVVS